MFLVAGYTGYIPSDMNIAVPNKGHTTHLGRDAGVDVMEKIAMETTLSRVPTSVSYTHLTLPTILLV